MKLKNALLIGALLVGGAVINVNNLKAQTNTGPIQVVEKYLSANTNALAAMHARGF